MKSAEIRSAYLEFFRARGHTVVPSSSLVPANDPTLLFANSGMVQFKDALAGRERRDYVRATSAQRCVRAGGKHNDLENVGYTARHHTFFEMMGNFSFGDYFKRETIGWAWEFITGVLKIDPARLWVTVHEQDLESEQIWIDEIGFPKDRITRLGDGSNFWTMGDTGPCGPNTEIFYDHGPEVFGSPPGTPDENGDRFVEIWNLVFPQFDLQRDGRRLPLEQHGVDTGMGLERVAAVMQGVHSNYEIDTFRSVLRAAAELAGVTGDTAMLASPSLRVIADHIRSTAFLIADGVLPGNEERNYTVRRIMRRALRHGHKLGIRDAFFHKLVPVLAAEMGVAYPSLTRSVDHVSRVVLAEEQRFAETLAQGMDVLEREIGLLRGTQIPGEVVFRLYDTFGFPSDLTADIARERNLTVDDAGFGFAMQQQRERARASSRFSISDVQLPQLEGSTAFVGYEADEAAAKVVAVFVSKDGVLGPSEKLASGEQGCVVLDRTPFYAEAGGQVGDQGEIAAEHGVLRVADTRLSGGRYLHFGEVVSGELRVDAAVLARVDSERRGATALNHSATHLLHAALRHVLGSHVEQKGSLVNPNRLRFDFTHYDAMTPEQIRAVERLVNEQVLANSDVQTAVLTYDDAVARGAMALFGEKYGDKVRVLTMGDGFSVELCGGTHASRTGDIGGVRVLSESGVAAGVRRIEALTGKAVSSLLDQSIATLDELATLLKGTREDVVRKVQGLLDQNRALGRELEQFKAKAAASRGSDLAASAVDVRGISVLTANIGEADSKTLLATLDSLRGKLPNAVVVLASIEDGKINLVAGVAQALVGKLKAGDLVRDIGFLVGARGGGRPDMARAGGGERLDALPAALEAVTPWVESRA